MSKWDKLIERILTLPNDVRFDEIKKILISYGYTMHQPRRGSSHYTFRKQGKPPITLVKKSPVKRVYVELLKEIIEENEKDR